MNITLSEEYIEAAKELEIKIAQLITEFEDKYQPLQVESWAIDRISLCRVGLPKTTRIQGVDIHLTIG